jgi:hypothetical protein
MLWLYQAIQTNRCFRRAVCAPLRIWRKRIFWKPERQDAVGMAYRAHEHVVLIRYDLTEMGAGVGKSWVKVFAT